MHGNAGDPTQGMYNKIMGLYDNKDDLYKNMDAVRLDGQPLMKTTFKPEMAGQPKHYLVPTISPAQSEKQFKAFQESQDKCNIQMPDFLHTFNIRTLQKLNVDIVPTPDPEIYVCTKGNLYLPHHDQAGHLNFGGQD